MPAFNYNTFSLQLAHDYFAHLNPLAQRIASDISATKSHYGQLWCNLKPSEQNDILNDTLIKPEISLKYFDNFSSSVASLSSSSTISSSAALSSNSAEHILQSLSKSKEQKSSISASASASMDSVTDTFIKQSQYIHSSTLATRAQRVTALQFRGKLKPPSSPPPPPPVGIAKTSTIVHTIKNKTMLEIPKVSHNKRTKETNEMKTDYGFDGRDLRSYAAQKVALKVVYDDVLGAYIDEHSRPFSYRTNSQINLHKQHVKCDLVDVTLQGASDEVFLLPNEPSDQKTIQKKFISKNHKQLQQELKKTLKNQFQNTPIEGPTNINVLENIIYKRFYDSNDRSPGNNYKENKLSTSVAQVSKFQPSKLTRIPSLGNVIICGSKLSNSVVVNYKPDNTCLRNKVPKQENMTYAVYTDAYFEVGESEGLMYNCSKSGISTVSSNSSTTSEEDEHTNYDYDDPYDDGKALCEDIRLLENDLNGCKGFDFLNNW